MESGRFNSLSRLKAFSQWRSLALPLSCQKILNKELWLRVCVLAYNLGNLLRTLALAKAVEQWSPTALRERLVEIGAKMARHGRYVTFQLAVVACLIGRLRSPDNRS